MRYCFLLSLLCFTKRSVPVVVKAFVVKLQGLTPGIPCRAFFYGGENVDRRGEGYNARRWPEGTFVLCGGKCTFGPLACHMRCCPWDAGEHILAFCSGIPRGTRTTNPKVTTRLLG